MTTVKFRTSSSATWYSYDSIVIAIDYINDETVYTDISFNNKKIIHASWKRWNIKLGYLSETQQDNLLLLLKEEAPQMDIGGTTYNILIKGSSIKTMGAAITAINKTKV